MSVKRVLVIAGSDSSGGAYVDLCFPPSNFWPFPTAIKLMHTLCVQRSRSRSEGSSRPWLLCPDRDHGSNGAKHPWGAGHLRGPGGVCQEANQCRSGRCRSRCCQIRWIGPSLIDMTVLSADQKKRDAVVRRDD